MRAHRLRPSIIRAALSAAALAIAVVPLDTARAQTMVDSLISTYRTNPDLNAARSELRSVDESIAIAKSGNRPQIFGNIQSTFSRTVTRNARIVGLPGSRNLGDGSNPITIGVSLVQPIFQGFQTRNNIRQAEAAVRAQRGFLRNTEQNVLLDAATAFFDVILAREVLRLNEADLTFLIGQVDAARDRFEVGEGTRTDVSQAEARRAEAESNVAFATANLETARATFRQVTGLTAANLSDNINIDRYLPKNLNTALSVAQAEHPAIEAAIHNVDVALFNARSLEGQYLPEISVTGTAQTTLKPDIGGGGIVDTGRVDAAELGINMSIPIYQGGLVSAQVRQAKEDLGTARIQVDSNRDAVRQAVVASWSNYRAALAAIESAKTGVFAAQLALDGVIEEQRVGQRTTLDVLDSQSDLVDAQVTLAQAQRDKGVAAYNVLAAIGRLSARQLTLRTEIYQPKEHYVAVKDKWFGLRTPDGR